MNILDENFPDDERRLLLTKRIRVQKIGRDIGRKGTKDDDIIPILHELTLPTFFTLDEDFYDRRFCHRAYCLIFWTSTTMLLQSTCVACFGIPR